MQNPCYNCSDRYLGCHSKCIKYIDWKQYEEARKQQIKDSKSVDSVYYGAKKYAMDRSKKRLNGKRKER